MARYVKDGGGRPGGGNGKGWGKGAYSDPTDEGDHLQGLHDEPDTIDGLGGDDNINGFSGDDILTGGTGADDITTGQGADTVDLGVMDDNQTPEDPLDDTYVGDGENDTVNIGVEDDQPDESGDLFDTILGYEVADDVGGVYTPNDTIALDGIDNSVNQFVDGTVGAGGASADGEIVDRITAAELETYLWVTDSGELVFDADGNTDADPADDDILAMLSSPDGSPADAGVTVSFTASVEVVSDISLGTTVVQDADYVAVWNGDDWLVSVDGGDFIA